MLYCVLILGGIKYEHMQNEEYGGCVDGRIQRNIEVRVVEFRRVWILDVWDSWDV